MATNRIKKVGGIYRNEDFNKLLRQLNGRALLVVTIINQHCEECIKLHKFVGQLEQGFIDKLPQLVMVHGISDVPLTESGESSGRPSGTKKANGEGEKKEKTKLGDSRIFSWDGIPGGHGYAIFLNENDILTYKDEAFNHDEYVSNIIDNIRRFRSSIKTIAGLKGKRIFIEKKRSGIVIETSGTTQNSQILELENKVKSYEAKLKIPVFFCKGLNQEISYIVEGEIKQKLKGFNFDKLLRKIKK
ncbi:MAG: hypothetical protein HN745_29245 [Deltaproteobacteria bacterium]|nr:hypothetical protein [Deltaproteobacteria bacterium]